MTSSQFNWYNLQFFGVAFKSKAKLQVAIMVQFSLCFAFFQMVSLYFSNQFKESGTNNLLDQVINKYGEIYSDCLRAALQL